MGFNTKPTNIYDTDWMGERPGTPMITNHHNEQITWTCGLNVGRLRFQRLPGWTLVPLNADIRPPIVCVDSWADYITGGMSLSESTTDSCCGVTRKPPWHSYTKMYSYYRCESLTHTYKSHYISSGREDSQLHYYKSIHTLTRYSCTHTHKHQARCCWRISNQCETKKLHFFLIRI